MVVAGPTVGGRGMKGRRNGMRLGPTGGAVLDALRVVEYGFFVFQVSCCARSAFAWKEPRAS